MLQKNERGKSYDNFRITNQHDNHLADSDDCIPCR